LLLHLLYTRHGMESYWPAPVTLERVKKTILALFSLHVERPDGLPLAITYLLLITIAILFALYKRDRPSSLKILYLSILAILPLVGVITASLISPNVTILVSRTIMVFAPPIAMLAAVGLTSVPNRAFTAVALLLSSAISSWWLYSSSYYT